MLSTIDNYSIFCHPTLVEVLLSQPTIAGICVQDELFTEVWVSEERWRGQ